MSIHYFLGFLLFVSNLHIITQCTFYLEDKTLFPGFTFLDTTVDIFLGFWKNFPDFVMASNGEKLVKVKTNISIGSSDKERSILPGLLWGYII